MTDLLRETLQASLGQAYTLTTELGGGGMSRVFVAREEALGRAVVVKVLSSEIAEGLSVERFAREIRVAAALQEPHIVPLLAAGVTALGMPYYTMPFVRGASLRERLAKGPLPVDEALHLLRDVAQALAYAHENGVVHRDIKPENILLSSGTAVVTDFGIAKALQLSRTIESDTGATHGITRTGTSLGTPAYMAPEQAAGDPATDQRADLYAWGVVAYELLTGQHPFAAHTSPQQLMRANLTEVPAGFSAEIPVAPVIAALVLQCLAKDPDDRPASAMALLQQLHEGRQGSANQVAENAVRTRTLQRALAMAAVVVMALVATGMWLRDTAQRTTPSSAAAEPVMMAVLPFEHVGPADQQPFTDGLTDAVTAKLGGLSSLLVIDRRSAATYRGTTKRAQQIGKELGVRYLLEGVVRWALDGAGSWRARVTPTLVDTKAGTIIWAGTPVDVTLTDPFTAQGSIASDVAQAMEVVVLPAERVQLTRRFTDNPQALAAYQRGQQIYNEHVRSSASLPPQVLKRVIREVDEAIALDSNFAEAWGAMASMSYRYAVSDFGDSADITRSRKRLDLALQRAPTNWNVLLSAALWSWWIDGERTKSASLVTKALAIGRNDARVLSGASSVLQYAYPDSARALAVRAAQLDPRSVYNLRYAAVTSMNMNRWADARRFGEAGIALDSTDERSWETIVNIAMAEGDSIALQALSSRVRLNVRNPSSNVACGLAYGSKQLSAWYLGLSATQQGVVTLSDSVWYYDCKTDAAARLRGATYSRVYSDSLIALLLPSRIARTAAQQGSQPLTQLANAYANVGNRSAALALATRVVDDGRRVAGQDTLPTEFGANEIAEVYARVGDAASAIRWLRVSLRQGGVSVGYFKMDPGLRSLHGTEAFARFVRENEH